MIPTSRAAATAQSPIPRPCKHSSLVSHVIHAATSAALVVAALAGPRDAQPAGAAPNIQLIAAVGGQPDDIAVDSQGRLVWGDLASNTIRRLQSRRVLTIARGISVPEGIVPLPDGKLVVAEQGRDRIDVVDRAGRARAIYTLQPVVGQEGVDGIGRGTTSGEVLVPDSPRGTVLRLSISSRRARIVMSGLGRPVDAAVDRGGNILVPDEHLDTLAVLGRHGRVTFKGNLSTPDDVAVDARGRAWVTTLGDGGLWSVDPGGTPRIVLRGLANPQGLALDHCGDPIVVEQASGRIVRLLLTSASRNCRF